ncbi:HNH endonuclease [Pedobacter sp. MR2016-24]|uniref:HNH endonuclease n=1 Tax=Pedobacter sp. MR2016-24 TaxID=2994466 RepID=UPI0022477238|nr:HNH endonuclease [Pedobacter sp. MR2016-24]MCX2485071.1 HNH endonuclease [Pedobacter sp. MR2016-24]
MNWFRIPKETSPRPTKGLYYSDWKEELSFEAKGQCVYCAINNRSFGGVRNFHVEHYKPKSLPAFIALEHDYSNLYYACSICNCFKGNAWPNDPDENFNNNSFPDPSKVDYSEIFFVESDYKLKSDFVAGKYIIQRIFLNRPQLVLERRKNKLTEELKKQFEITRDTLYQFSLKDPSNPLIKVFLNVIETSFLLIEESKINPYNADQIHR